MIRLFIVAGVRLYRDGLAEALTRDGLSVVGVHDGERDVLAHVSAKRPDVVLLDMATANSYATAREIHYGVPDTAVVALGVGASEAELLAYAEAGVTGYVSRDACMADLVPCIESAARGEMICSPSLARGLVRRLAALAAERTTERPPVRLTEREQQIAALLEQDLSNKEIGSQLGIEVATVKHHVHNVLEKMGVRRRYEAVRVLKRAQRGVPTLLPRGAGREFPVVIRS
jgi:two-component system nitrate/nitrite response regulator NarL